MTSQPQSLAGIFNAFNLALTSLLSPLRFGTRAAAYSHFSVVVCIFQSRVVVTR